MKKFKIDMTFWLTLGVKPSEVAASDGEDVAGDLEEQFFDPDPYFDSGNFQQFGVGETRLEHNCTKLGTGEDEYARKLDIQITGEVEDIDGLLEYLVNADMLEDATDLGTFTPREFWFNCLEDCDTVLHPVTDDNLTDDAVKNDIEGSLEIGD